MRPRSLCYCADLRPVSNRTRIVVLQHQKERFHPLNTVRIAERSLQSVEVHRDLPRRLDARVAPHLGPGTAVLFPSSEARDLETLEEHERPRTVIVLDGTWHQAKTLLRDIPSLKNVPRVRFSPQRPSEYRIRKEPQEDYLSSIEAISHILHLLEPDTPGLSSLRDAFASMIDKNIHARRQEEMARKKLKPKAQKHRFPPLLSGAHEGPLWAIYAEGSGRFPDDESVSDHVRGPLVIYGALLGPEGRPLRGFGRILRTPGAPSSKLLERLGFSRDEQLESGIEPSRALSELTGMISKQALLAAFNSSSLSILREVGALSELGFALKGAYCDFARFRGDARRSWGSLSDILLRENLIGTPTVAFDEETPRCLMRPGGRGLVRLGHTVLLLKYLKAHADLEVAAET